MRITKLHIENFRGFRGTHDIEFSDSNIHAIVGVNGAGKTSILDALGHFLESMLTNANIVIHTDAELRSRENIHVKEKKLNITCFITWNKYGIKTKDKLIIRELQGGFYDNYIEIINKLIERKDLPIFLYYRSKRTFFIQTDDNQFSDLLFEVKKDDAYKNCMNAHTDFNYLFLWYVKQINIQNSRKVAKKDLEYEIPTITAINNAIETFFNEVNDNSFDVKVGVRISEHGNQTLIIKKPVGEIEFNRLSDGEKMVIGMVLDIAYRMSIANPQLENPLVSEGIVLIDELEQHLHPKWQMSILKALTTTFPNVQFIVTTHSPLVINQLENHQLSILDDFKIIPGKEVHKVYGRDVNAIIEDFMGASHRPLDVKTLMNDIEKLLDDEHPNTERARKKLDELKAIIDPNDYEVIKLETQIVMEEDETY